jgi:hypothetical protein
MTGKGLKVLAAALGVLVAAWLLVSLLQERGAGGARDPSPALAGFFSGVTPQGVEEIRLRGPGAAEPVVLRGSEGRWTVNGFAADSSAVAGFWSTVAGAAVGARVAANPDNHARLGVHADSAWALEVQLPGEVRTLLMGNPGTSYGTVYVRLPQEDAVHLMKGNLRADVTRDLDQWRDKLMAQVDTAVVWRMEVTRGNERFILERVDSLWTLDGEGGSDPLLIRNLLDELAFLQASGFHAPGDSLAAAGGTVTALGRAGDTLLFLEVGAGEGDRWARVAGDSVLYRLPSWRVGRLLPERETLRAR